MIPGEMYRVEFPTTDGREQSGRRPAIVIQDDAHAGALSSSLVVPVTGQPLNSRFPATVVVAPSDLNGLLKLSIVLVFQMRAVDRRRFHNRIAVVEPEVLTEIYEALDQLTGRIRTPGAP